MTVVSFTSSPTLADGQPAIADDGSLAFREAEDLFQSGVHDENFEKGSVLRGESFRRNGLSEVFSRKTTNEHWSVRPGTGKKSWDIPGGALRFRLRHPADVLVFFTASIFRLNVYDAKLEYGEDGAIGAGPSNTGVRAKYTFYINAWWEGSDSEPGSHYLQARALLRGTNNYVDRPDVSRGIFLPWKIRPVDYDFSTRSPVPVPIPATRVCGALAPVTPFDTGRLQAGWHNVRHTANWGSTSELTGRGQAPTMVFGNTELVVVANYGRSADDLNQSKARPAAPTL